MSAGYYNSCPVYQISFLQQLDLPCCCSEVTAEFQGDDAILSTYLCFEGLAEKRITARKKSILSPHYYRTVLHNVPLNTSAILLACLFDS